MRSNIKNKTTYLLPMIFVLVLFFGFGLGNTKKAHAAGTCWYSVLTSGDVDMASNVTPPVWESKSVAASDDAGCKANCKDPTHYKNCTFSPDANYDVTTDKTNDAANQKALADAAQKTAQDQAKLKAQQDAAAAAKNNSDDTVCKGISLYKPLTWINCILLYILRLINLVLQGAFTLFTNILDPVNITNVIGNSVIYKIWAMVRDVLNVAFIMAILFSAFCTIFQISKYSYKNLLLTIIIMALLVNFSFPIARVIIDISNVLMYSFIQGFGITNGSGGFLSQVVNGSGLSKLFANLTTTSDTSYLIALIIFTFIFAITILVMAVLFVIRLVVLTILVIFSPIAFVGPTLPFLSKYSSDWWDNLFKYSFFGPTMAFMLYVSLKMMTAVSSMGGKMQSTAGKIGDTPGLISSIAFFSVPIVILWAGMAVAQKMSIIGAGTLVGGAEKFAKGAGKKFGGYNWGKKRLDAYSAERKARADDKFKKNWGKSLGQKVNKWQDTARTLLPATKKDRFGSVAAQKRLDARLANANKEVIKNKSEGKEGITTQDLVGSIAKHVVPATAPKTKDEKIDAAANVKQALSRGKEYETQLTQAIRSTSPEMKAFITQQIQVGNITAAQLTPQIQNQIDSNNITDNKFVNQIKGLVSAEARKVIAAGEKAN